MHAYDGYQRTNERMNRSERAVMKRKEERERDRSLKSATSKEALERATIAKMKLVTGADESICIATLRDHGYDVEESIEAYLEKM